jgi:oligopeptidase A
VTTDDLLNSFMESRGESAKAFDRTLTDLIARIDAISGQSSLSRHEFVELTALYNNASYILLYLESNAQHITVDFLDRHRAALARAPERNRRLRELVGALRFEEHEHEASRRAFLEHLACDSDGDECEDAAELSALRARAGEVLRALTGDSTNLLVRLGATLGSTSPDAAFYVVLSRTGTAAARAKLAESRAQIARRWAPELATVIDEMTAVRHRQSARRGLASPATETLMRSRLTPADVQRFTHAALARARSEHQALHDMLEHRYGPGGVNAHFGFHVEKVRGSRAIPAVPLQTCIDFAFDIASTLFGLEAERVQGTRGPVISYDLTKSGNTLGRINFDLWGLSSSRTSNTMVGLRNGADRFGVRQKPVAHVSCRFKSFPGRPDTINFQNAHSLLHEFGHALNHLLVTPRMPNLSGLEHLPLERLEILSMWFERWVFHHDFEIRLGLGQETGGDFQICREIKRLEYVRTHLQRSVLAALDFELNAGSCGIKGAYAALDAKFHLSELCELHEVLPSFVLPMMMANPGGYFAYVWGAAASAERFQRLHGLSLDALRARGTITAEFADCFDFDAPSREPSLEALFRFYRPKGATGI